MYIGLMSDLLAKVAFARKVRTNDLTTLELFAFIVKK